MSQEIMSQQGGATKLQCSAGRNMRQEVDSLYEEQQG